MLVALFALLFLGGGGNSFLLGQIDVALDNTKEVVQAEDRRDQAVEILKALEDDTEAFIDRQADRAKNLGELKEAPGLDPDAVDAVWESAFSDVEAYHDLILSRREELKTVLPRDEWGQVFAAD